MPRATSSRELGEGGRYGPTTSRSCPRETRWRQVTSIEPIKAR
jgi:hypothetical protein